MIARRCAAFALAIALCPSLAHAAATIVILNTNAANVGFNDPTVVAPVGGNPGTTLGQQRLNVFQAAAAKWGAELTSSVVITIDAAMVAQTCTATTATLGSAGATQVFSFNAGSGVFLNTWYPKALVNKVIGVNADPTVPDIRARFNVNLGQPGCLTGVPFYLGLDNNHGPAIDLLTVLLHEFGHGLGFQSFTAQNGGLLGPPFQPSVFNKFQLDLTTNKMWDVMTNTERAASTLNTRNVVWTGANVTAASSQVLLPGTPLLTTTAPASLAGQYLVGTAAFGPALTAAGVIGEVMPLTGTGDQLLGCQPFNAVNVAAVTGKIALIDRGVCGFPDKVANAQNAGARAVIIADNVAGAPPPGLGGANPAIVIPTVRITLADAAKFKDFLRFRSRTHSGLFVTIGLDNSLLNGADAFGRVLLYTPNPFVGGSSVSHWDTSAFRNLLMEPNFNGDLTHEVKSPFDLTLEMLHDIGW
jgi:PA domain